MNEKRNTEFLFLKNMNQWITCRECGQMTLTKEAVMMSWITKH